jgi:hypothetical protein
MDDDLKDIGVPEESPPQGSDEAWTPADQHPVIEEPDDSGEDAPEKPNPWLITGVVALIMLVIGGLLGYNLRPVYGPEARAAKATQTVVAEAAITQAAQNKDLMAYVVSQVRHWQGPEDAPVTVIEFSDFQ